MGFLRLLNPHRERLADGAVDRTYIAGLDCMPTACLKVWESDRVLRLERDSHESGNVYIPWQVEGHGELLLCTATLMERDRPYHLPVELARGTVNRSATQGGNMEVGRAARPRQPGGANSGGVADVHPSRHIAARRVRGGDWRRKKPFGKAWTQRCCWGANTLGRHSSSGTRERAPCRPCWPETWAANDAGQRGAHVSSRVQLGHRALLLARRPARSRPLGMGQCDKQVQWCYRHGLKVIGGPLVPLDRDACRTG